LILSVASQQSVPYLTKRRLPTITDPVTAE
jgi:hypothetical protein